MVIVCVGYTKLNWTHTRNKSRRSHAKKVKHLGIFLSGQFLFYLLFYWFFCFTTLLRRQFTIYLCRYFLAYKCNEIWKDYKWHAWHDIQQEVGLRGKNYWRSILFRKFFSRRRDDPLMYLSSVSRRECLFVEGTSFVLRLRWGRLPLESATPPMPRRHTTIAKLNNRYIVLLLNVISINLIEPKKYYDSFVVTRDFPFNFSIALLSSNCTPNHFIESLALINKKISLTN